jgi:hypothetical protein
VWTSKTRDEGTRRPLPFFVLSDGWWLLPQVNYDTIIAKSKMVTGRKGSGKTALFIQVRDRIRLDKKNIVVDLKPEG